MRVHCLRSLRELGDLYRRSDRPQLTRTDCHAAVLHARRGAPFRTRAPQKPTGGSYPTVDGCMDYAEWGMGRYWCKKSYSFATCGSRRFRSRSVTATGVLAAVLAPSSHLVCPLRRRCTVSAPVCEEDQCGTGYKWNPVTGLCDW
jgi:hypothetical protein